MNQLQHHLSPRPQKTEEYFYRRGAEFAEVKRNQFVFSENLKPTVSSISAPLAKRAVKDYYFIAPLRENCASGQAMIEFTIALVAILAVIIGTILLNKMAWAHIHTMTTARATAGALALDLIYQSPLDAKFISDWEAGADNMRYTHDDEPILDGTAVSLVGDIVADAGLDSIAAPTNAISKLQSSPTPINEFYLVKGSESMAVDLSLIPAVSRLISGESSISVESEVWLAWTGGIY